MGVKRRLVALCAALLAAATLGGQSGPPTAYPSPYRFELVPVPDLRALRGLRGQVDLRWAPSPFGVSVTRDGRLLYEPMLELEGLPPPASLGPYTTFVAWATTPVLDPMLKLGEVGNGSNRWGPEAGIAFDRFLLLITAEASPAVETRQGRLVLRGMSPTMAMMPDSHLMLPSVPATPHSAAGDEAHGVVWTHPPHPPGLAMMPGFENLQPTTGPYLPAADSEATPVAQPMQLVRLRDGQTLDLVAAPVRREVGGRAVVLYGFNGQVPGPLIEVTQGATIVVRFHNRTHLPTTVHWHGLRLDNAYDGVPGLTQDAVEPGESFTYRVTFPDGGIYWYHPHHREDVLQDMGLYGNMRVRPASKERRPATAHREVVLLLDDLLVTDQGLYPYGREAATHALMGRFGNLLLVNGEPEYRLAVARGEVVRFFLTNASSTRTFNLSFGDARIKVIGSDLGLYEREAWADSVLLGPAERYVVDVRFEGPGTVPLLHRARALEHTFGRFRDHSHRLGTIEVGGDEAQPDYAGSFARLHTNADVAAEIDRVVGDRDRVYERDPDLELFFTLELQDLPPNVLRRLQVDRVYFHPIEWAGTMPVMNWLTTAAEARWILRDGDSGRENDAIDWRFGVGERVKIRLRNDRDAVHAMQHPFHIHGQRFVVLAYNGRRNPNLVWKDTVLLPMGSEVDILLELSNPGAWMAHCHIAEHLEAGMKMTLTVAEGGSQR